MYKSLLGMYTDLKEAGSISDFPNILSNVMYKELIRSFESVTPAAKLICKKGRLQDFKLSNRVMLHGFANPSKIVENGVRVGEYKDQKLTDNKYQIQLDTDGMAFSIGREVIINDDQNALSQVPSMIGMAMARSVNEGIVNMIEGDHQTYDAASLFAVAHSNYGNTTLANTATGKAAVQTGINAIENATDSVTGKKMGLKAKYIVTGVDLQFVVLELLKSMNFIPTSTNGGGTYNGLQDARLIPVVIPEITSSTAWYLFADPNTLPCIEIGYLNGKETPDLLQRKPTMVNLAGGDDPYGYEFDDLLYKARFDYGLALGYYQSIYRGKA